MDLKIEYVSINDIRVYANNSKLHPAEQIEQIKKSIQEFGFNDPLAIWNGEIVEGHGRYIAAQELGIDPIPVIRLDSLSDEQRKAYALVHNKLTMNTDFDLDILAVELDDIFDIDMADFGFEFDAADDPAEVIEDEAPKPPEEPKTKLGDVYQLGQHRLICGDSTDVAVIDRLMDGVKAKLLLTDPPYGTTAVEWDCDIDLEKMWDVVIAHSQGDSAKLIFTAQPFTTTVINSNTKDFKYEIVWKKTQPLGFLNANRMPLRTHENILVFYKNLPTYNPIKRKIGEEEAKERGVNIGRKRIKKANRCVLYGNVKEQDYIDDGTRYPGDVIEFSNWNGALFGNGDNVTVHPTQKPIELLSYLIKTYSNEDDTVMDVFGGSGSTLIACEQLNRKCYMAELDERYVSVIVNRYLNFTGKKDEIFCIRDGQRLTYDEVFGE